MRTLLLLLCFSPVIFTSEVPDEGLILRLRPSLTVAGQKVHVRNDSLGKVLIDENGTFVDPLASSSALPSLSCVGTFRDCAWKSNQEWRKTNVSPKEPIFIKLPAGTTPCSFNNGGCQWKCRVTNHSVSECYCPQNYSLNSDGETCSGFSQWVKLDAKTENKQFGLNGYGNKMVMQWLIVAPRGHYVKLFFSWIRTEKNFDNIRIYEGHGNNLIINLSGYHENITIISTHCVLLVRFTSDFTNVYDGFMAEYFFLERGIRTLQLNNGEGYLSTPIVLPDMLCVSTVYTAPSKRNVSMYIGSGLTEATELSETHYHQIGNWHIKRFKKMFTGNEIGMIHNLTVKMTGQGNRIMRISGCDASVDEDVYDLGITSGNTQHIRPASDAGEVRLLKASSGARQLHRLKL